MHVNTTTHSGVDFGKGLGGIVGLNIARQQLLHVVIANVFQCRRAQLIENTKHINIYCPQKNASIFSTTYMASEGEVGAIHEQKSCDFEVRFAACVHQCRAANLIQLDKYDDLLYIWVKV